MPEVLVAEDSGVISLSLEDALTDGGYTIAGPFPTCSQALTWLQDRSPDLALLDLVLRDGPCVELARALRHRNIPVLFLSGYNHHDVPADLEDVTWLEKPVSYDRLMHTLTSLQKPGSAGTAP